VTDAPPSTVPPEAPGGDDVPEQIAIRRAKRERLLADGQEAYPVGVPRTHTIAQVRAAYPDLPAGEETTDEVGVAGRVVFLRNTGKLCFATLQDGEGNRLQAMLSLANVGEDRLAAFKSDVDLGDHLFVHGRVICSRRGELSVLADSWRLASKALRPLPNLYEGTEMSEEARVRQRYLDLVVRPAARATVRRRAEVMRSLRAGFHERGFVEVETPMLQTQPGGAAARPFVTHMNAFDIDLYLRIAPELFLKQAAVGGIEKVFEINRNFRNEGADSTHSPEFAMVEAYEAYGDYDTMAELTRSLVQTAARDAFGTTLVTLADGSEYEVGGEWAQIRAGGRVRPRGRPGEGQPRQARRGAVRAPGGRAPVGAHVRARLPRRDQPAHARAPQQAGRRREVGPVRARLRAGHRVLRARRPGGPARAVRGAGAARGRGRPGGDARRRGLPHRDGVRHAAVGRHGDGRRPAAHGAHRSRHPRDHPVPAREAAGVTMDGILPVLAAVLPSIGVGLIFWFVMRAVVNADRNERRAIARFEAQERAQAAAAAKDKKEIAGPNV
jgi:hypothetical protein